MPGFVRPGDTMSVSLRDLEAAIDEDTLEALDFDIPCSWKDCEARATHTIFGACGCATPYCEPCMTRFVQLCLAMLREWRAVMGSVVPSWECLDCGTEVRCHWPIVRIVPL
jgi:hypothetical protein